MSKVQHIKLQGTEVLLATVIFGIPNDNAKNKTEFVTEPGHSIQVGILHRPNGTVVKAHQHLPTQKTVSGCQEVLIVHSGHIRVDVYCTEKILRNTLWVGAGDIYIQYCGGHEFIFEADSQFIEIKQGPYAPEDKVFFNPRSHEQMK